jgi:hypothetical protein
MQSGLPWSESFVRDLAEKEFRDEFVADQIRSRIAMLIRALREQSDRNWSQTELGRRMGGKPQSVISRLEDPDYGKLSLQTLFEVAAAYDLPLWIDIPEWEDWLGLIKNVPSSETTRRSFDVDRLVSNADLTPSAGQHTEEPVGLSLWQSIPQESVGQTAGSGTLAEGQSFTNDYAITPLIAA